MRTASLAIEAFHRAALLNPIEASDLLFRSSKPLFQGHVLLLTTKPEMADELEARRARFSLEVDADDSARATLLLLSLRCNGGSVNVVIPLADEKTFSWLRGCVERGSVAVAFGDGLTVVAVELSLVRHRAKLRRVLANAATRSDRTHAAAALVNSPWLHNADTMEEESSHRWHWFVEGLEAHVSAAQTAAIATWRAFGRSR
ncbi:MULTISPECIES: hypothetical protein [unclassified Variovorax]|uniref:hypothetical protein n=1 Tax=unclassified Variovorax TaxID=663243 RepID=UPI003ED14D4E